ncbi:MAG TPA: hypothetical protein VFV81_02495 [Verrucomicrobiae bacterium]|nr:hypothetical protein [Verrucomicrobiae bacterium]
MKIVRALALTSLCLSLAAPVGAANINVTKNFSTDPLQGGWQIFGDTNLFQWNAAAQNLDVTWDSSQPNSYFYHPLGVTLTKDYDFNLQFDLELNDVTTGNESGKTSPMAIGIGFLNFAEASHAGFGRGIYGSAPNVAEFDYFPPGSYSDGVNTYPIAPTLTPTFISSDAYVYSPSAYIPYELEFPTGIVVHVSLVYTGTNQTLVTTFQTNGVDCLDIPPVVLSNDFASNDNFAVDAFCISSYSSTNDPYDSVLAHGTVANITLTVPQPAIQNLSGAFSNGLWQVQFVSQPIWNYTLQRSPDFQSWTDVASSPGGDGTNLVLSDTNSPGPAFYRVRADRL